MGHAIACPSADAAHRRPAASFTVISPVLSQLVSFSKPPNFVAGFENTNNGRYIRKAARWQDRLKRLTPPKLCAIVAGEKAPYPSSIGKL